jgi:hypothetical protein
MFRNFIDSIYDRLGQSIASYIDPAYVAQLSKSQKYYEGAQKQPLTVKRGQMDDNLVTNFIGLAIERATSLLFGGGVKFHAAAGPESAEQQYLDAVWNVNKKEILLHRTGNDGEIFGTAYYKIVPETIEYQNVMLPRIVLLDPKLMAIETDPMDIEYVEKYVFQMKIPAENRTVMEVVRRAEEGKVIDKAGVQDTELGGTWIIERFENDGNSASWRLISRVEWLYPFPPILHWQNLPSVHSVYGVSGIADVLDIQDRHNFIDSNISKIIRYHAHPKTWGSGLPTTPLEKVSWGADELIKISSENGKLSNLEMQSDLSSSRNYKNDLKQEIFNLTRNVDINSVQDKIGALTNFGLRVLYGDALSKNSTRRLLYGDALAELNRRLLALAEFPNTDTTVEWGPDLPQDESEDAKLILDDLNAGIVSKETAAAKRGYQWKSTVDENGVITTTGEEDKIASEQAANSNAQNQALARFFTGATTP